jgi:diadenosine tetraphosphate (Ap4A) HIT family hydrolase
MQSYNDFQLDSRLQNDTVRIASWPLCDLLLMNDANYPWCILVPRVVDISELFQLSRMQRQQLDLESCFLAATLMQIFEGDKMNVAALGNVVKQLHIHHVVRFSTDAAWPAPVWGRVPVQPYSAGALDKRLRQLTCLKQPDWPAISLSTV